MFPPALHYSLSLKYCFTYQSTCVHVPSHPLEQVGSSMTDLKMERCRGAQQSPTSHGVAVPADVTQKC